MTIVGKPPGVGRRSFLVKLGRGAMGTLGILAGLGSGCERTPDTPKITVKRESANRMSIDITANSLEDAERMTRPYGFYIQGLGQSRCGNEEAIFIAFDHFKVENHELGGTKPRGTSYTVEVSRGFEKLGWGGVTECDHGGSSMLGPTKTAPKDLGVIAFYPYPGVISRDETYALIKLLIENRDDTILNVTLRIYLKALEARRVQ